MVKPCAALYLSAVVCIPAILGVLPSTPRIRLTFKDLVHSGTSHALNFLLNSSDFRLLHLDQDADRLYVGARDYIIALDLHNINKEPLIIHWPASESHREECRMAGKGKNDECSNFVRVVERWNRTHLYVCGTGAFNPVCGFVDRGWRSEEYIFRMVPGWTESGKGKCPFDPQDASMSALVGGSLYAGVHVDFMGMDAALFRSLGNRPAIRTEQHDSRWLNDPVFLRARAIPDGSGADHKLYFFFRERALESGNGLIYSRIGRVCLNDGGGHRSLVNKWTSFLKARLVCGVGGDEGVETTFDELTDVFIQPTQDEKNPRIYGVFSTSGSVFRGSAVCVYSMADVRTVFNGPFSHREGLQFQWGPYTGRVPYPRPGTCAGGAFTPGIRSTRDYRDGFLRFVRGHPLMHNAVLPAHRRPLLVRADAGYRVTALAVDQVNAADGSYEVLFLGTDLGTVQKVVVVTDSEGRLEELTLEEMHVFRTPAAVKDIRISSKRQQLYVSSRVGVTQLSLHRCARYGRGCADCCLARDPYCAWDGEACSRYTPGARRRSRRQDVRNGDPLRHCQGHNMKAGRLDSNTVQFGVEGSSAFLECLPPSPRASTKWLVQRSPSSRRKLLRRDPRLVRTDQGLLVRSLEPTDAAVYHCVATENGYSRTVARLDLRLLGPAALRVAGADPHPPDAPAIGRYCRGYWQRLQGNGREPRG